jgi:hypothetical protein
MSLQGLLNQDITLYLKSSYDAYGRETLGSGTDYRCRFQAVKKNKLLPNGEVATIDAIVYMAGTVDVDVNDKVTYSGVNYKVLGKNTQIDGQGNTNHLKLELVKFQI